MEYVLPQTCEELQPRKEGILGSATGIKVHQCLISLPLACFPNCSTLSKLAAFYAPLIPRRPCPCFSAKIQLLHSNAFNSLLFTKSIYVTTCPSFLCLLLWDKFSLLFQVLQDWASYLFLVNSFPQTTNRPKYPRCLNPKDTTIITFI